MEKSAETVQKDENKVPSVIIQENEGRADSFNKFSDEPKIECELIIFIYIYKLSYFSVIVTQI